MKPEDKGREILRTDADVKEALAQAGQAAPRVPRTSRADRIALLAFAGAALVAFAARAALTLPHAAALADIPLVDRALVTLEVVALALFLERLVEVHAIGRVASAVARFDLKRILRLVTGLVVAGIVVTTLFANWKATVTSLGLASLILGFALQTPITSFIGWVYVLVRRPYRVGDRIRMGEVTGDVIDVSYLDTTLWEFGGEYLSTDHPSGRVIKVPNALVLQTPVYNYSWPVFPWIWNEIKLHVAYDSDLELVARVMQEVAEEDLGEAMSQRVRTYREVLSRTPVDQLDVKEKPVVFFRVSENTWLEAIVRYLVHPKEAGRVKTRLLGKLLARLGETPERVRFPKGDLR